MSPRIADLKIHIVYILYFLITSDEVRCVAEVPADSIPSIANGEMSTFLKNSMAPQVRSKVLIVKVKVLRYVLTFSWCSNGITLIQVVLLCSNDFVYIIDPFGFCRYLKLEIFVRYF